MNHEFKINDFSLVISPFYIKIKDMIRWLPTANGYWAPINTDNVESYGSEVQIDYRKKITENHNINAQLGYSLLNLLIQILKSNLCTFLCINSLVILAMNINS